MAVVLAVPAKKENGEFGGLSYYGKLTWPKFDQWPNLDQFSLFLAN
jgi:hypothetical protein